MSIAVVTRLVDHGQPVFLAVAKRSVHHGQPGLIMPLIMLATEVGYDMARLRGSQLINQHGSKVCWLNMQNH